MAFKLPSLELHYKFEYERIEYYWGGGQNFRNNKVGHCPKSFGNPCPKWIDMPLKSINQSKIQ